MAKLRIINPVLKPVIEVSKKQYGISICQRVQKTILLITGVKGATYLLTDESGSIITDESLDPIYL